MHEFQPLIEDHKDIYKVINQFKETLQSTDKYEIIDELKNLKDLFNKVVNKHFVTEESIIFPKLRGKINNDLDLIDCVSNEHNDIQGKIKVFDELFSKYEANPSNLSYEALVQYANGIADTLYNHAYVEDMTIFAFAGILLNEDDKVILAEELAKLSCELKIK